MIKTIKGLLLILIITHFIGCQTKNITSSPLSDHHSTAKIDSLFKSLHEQDRFHGGIVITHEQETIYENYLGIADRSWNILVDENVKFDIASLNKSMIAALVLKAVEQGKLRLNDKLVDLLSKFSIESTFHPEITIHHLLCHRSGLSDYDRVSEDLQPNRFLKFKRLRFNNEEYVNFINKIEPIDEPDKQFYYSNFAYHLVTIILEETYAKSFDQILEENITLPLGLKNTYSEIKNEKIIPLLAKAYLYQDSLDEWHQNPFIDLSLGRRIFSTAADLNKWAQAMDTSGFLSKHSLMLMKQNHLSDISNSISYGYGWVVVNAKNKSKMGDLDISKPYIIHGGSTDGYKSMLVNINNGEYIISFLSNVGNRTQEMELVQQIVKILIK